MVFPFCYILFFILNIYRKAYGTIPLLYLFTLSNNPIVYVLPVPVCPYTNINPYLP